MATVKDFEENFNICATNNMFQWDLEKFKESHPTLYKTMLDAFKMTVE